jgi:hypothetical protein
VVSFCYIDEGVIATPGFETYLKQYARLFESLGRFRLVYVATKDKHFHSAQKIVKRFFDSADRKKTVAGQSFTEGLIDYFRLEHLFRTKQLNRLDAAKLDQLRALRKQFHGAQNEELFERWKRDGEEAASRFSHSDSAVGRDVMADFVTCRLEHNYDIFETHKPARPTRKPPDEP